MNILASAFELMIVHPFIFTCLVIYVVLEIATSTLLSLRRMKYSNAAARAVGRARAEGRAPPSSQELQEAINTEIESERNNPTSHLWNQLYSRSSFPLAFFGLGALYAFWLFLLSSFSPVLEISYTKQFVEAFLFGAAAILLFRGFAALINPLTNPVWIEYADRSSTEYKLRLRMLMATIGIFLTIFIITFITQITLTNV